MSRPLRIEFEGAVYHVTSRGKRRESIFLDDADRLALLDVIDRAMERFDAAMLAFCLMGNHYHFVLRTQRANLSQVMRHVNGVSTQAFNRRHGKRSGVRSYLLPPEPVQTVWGQVLPFAPRAGMSRGSGSGLSYCPAAGSKRRQCRVRTEVAAGRPSPPRQRRPEAAGPVSRAEADRAAALRRAG